MPEGSISQTQSQPDVRTVPASQQQTHAPDVNYSFISQHLRLEVPSASMNNGGGGAHPKCVRALEACLRAFDFAAMALGGVAAGSFVSDGYNPILPAVVAACGTSKLLSVTKSYELPGLGLNVRQAAISLSAGVLWFAIVAVASAAFGRGEPLSSVSIASAALVGVALIVMGRLVASLLLARWRRRLRFQRKLAILGLNDVSIDLISRIRADRSEDIVISGLYRSADDASRVTHGGLIVKGTVTDLVEHCGTGAHDFVLVALRADSKELDEDLTRRLVSTGCNIGTVTERELAVVQSAQLEQLGESLTVSVVTSNPPADRSVQKVVFDRCVAFVLLMVLMPAFLLIAVAIRLDSKGPVLFRQPRCGYKNRTFQILKFRTMFHELGDLLAERQTTRRDHRVTRVGRWLRWASLDELPQLVNVLKGDMSLVGPRPHALGTRSGQRKLQDIVGTYSLRHKVKPGITGLAQINGCRGALHSDDQVVKRVAYDMFYIENWSFRFDMKILFLTMFRGFGGANTY